jgi:hypothetical protein
MNKALAAIAAKMIRELPWVQASSSDAAVRHVQNANFFVYLLATDRSQR